MRMKRSTANKCVGLLFVMPWILGFVAFTLYPFTETIKYSFSTVRFLTDGIALDPVGLDNYVNVLFRDPDFLLRLPNFLMQMLCLVPMVLVFSIILAVLLNSKIKMRRLFRALFFLPVIIISGSVLENLKNFDATTLQGLQQFFVYRFIQENIPGFISTVILYIFDNIVIFLWFSGVQILIFLSGLQKVDHAIYEAASVDGASGWQKFWKITIPTLKPFLFLNAMYTVVDISNSSMNPIISIIRDSMFKLVKGFGFSAATTWLYFFLIVAVVLVYFVIFGRPDKIDRAVIKQGAAARRNKKGGAGK